MRPMSRQQVVASRCLLRCINYEPFAMTVTKTVTVRMETETVVGPVPLVGLDLATDRLLGTHRFRRGG